MKTTWDVCLQAHGTAMILGGLIAVVGFLPMFLLNTYLLSSLFGQNDTVVAAAAVLTALEGVGVYARIYRWSRDRQNRKKLQAADDKARAESLGL